jgi:hypothetical protein
MAKFEYKSYTFAYMEDDFIIGSDIKDLNKLGVWDWEVIAVTPVKLWMQVDRSENLLAFLKQEVEK